MRQLVTMMPKQTYRSFRAARRSNAHRPMFGIRAIAFGNLGIKKVNIRRTFGLSRCVRSQILMIFDPDATLQTQKRFPCVWDGDGPIWCQEGPRLRLAGIAAREIDGTCSPGHPCPPASAEDACAALVALLGAPTGVSRHGHIMLTGPTLSCRSDGSAGGNRTASWCLSPRTGDTNCAMVHGGWAARWDRYWNNHRC